MPLNLDKSTEPKVLIENWVEARSTFGDSKTAFFASSHVKEGEIPHSTVQETYVKHEVCAQTTVGPRTRTREQRWMQEAVSAELAEEEARANAARSTGPDAHFVTTKDQMNAHASNALYQSRTQNPLDPELNGSLYDAPITYYSAKVNRGGTIDRVTHNSYPFYRKSDFSCPVEQYTKGSAKC
eukprot:TRINITY_DN4289_c0_g1::TRINITY_DN4289_c0_g1_i1::g.8041::m.8041 TRINITY_DN4289_c0_g1::TRINITY_DN4289_c0_g1_i1::g.8041  ORF type:complete len:211 (+),score=27.99 TRINITY_DN4289_c0_g1_i1:85-633(+)